MGVEKKTRNIYKIIMLVVLTMVITALITTIAMYHQVGGSNVKYVVSTGGGDVSSIGNTFKSLRSFIEQRYNGEIDDTKMLESAIKGYVEGLEDPYSEYISKEEMEEYMQDAIGKYVGIGVYIANDTKNNQIVIIAPIQGGPAEEAGIQSGDILVAIDGIEYNGEQLSNATNKLKQQEGTKVMLTILRGEEKIEIEVERRTVKVNHVMAEVLENKIGYIQIATFDEGCYEEFVKKYDELKAHGIEALILDLRNNGGGIVKEAVNIADTMIEKGETILITESKEEGKEVTKAKQDRSITVPIVILVNEHTASASEILAGALKDKDNAKIIGTTTYGKGVIQTIFTLNDGSGLKLTTAEYCTPNGNVINKVGITPDEKVELPEGENSYSIERQKDTQLQKAIELLR